MNCFVTWRRGSNSEPPACSSCRNAVDGRSEHDLLLGAGSITTRNRNSSRISSRSGLAFGGKDRLALRSVLSRQKNRLTDAESFSIFTTHLTNTPLHLSSALKTSAKSALPTLIPTAPHTSHRRLKTHWQCGFSTTPARKTRDPHLMKNPRLRHAESATRTSPLTSDIPVSREAANERPSRECSYF